MLALVDADFGQVPTLRFKLCNDSTALGSAAPVIAVTLCNIHCMVSSSLNKR